jgi:hypothetical protein
VFIVVAPLLLVRRCRGPNRVAERPVLGAGLQGLGGQSVFIPDLVVGQQTFRVRAQRTGATMRMTLVMKSLIAPAVICPAMISDAPARVAKRVSLIVDKGCDGRAWLSAALHRASASDQASARRPLTPLRLPAK